MSLQTQRKINIQYIHLKNMFAPKCTLDESRYTKEKMLYLPYHESFHWHTRFSLIQQREPNRGLNCFLLSDRIKDLLFPSAPLLSTSQVELLQRSA